MDAAPQPPRQATIVCPIEDCGQTVLADLTFYPSLTDLDRAMRQHHMVEHHDPANDAC